MLPILKFSLKYDWFYNLSTKTGFLKIMNSHTSYHKTPVLIVKDVLQYTH